MRYLHTCYIHFSFNIHFVELLLLFLIHLTAAQALGQENNLFCLMRICVYAFNYSKYYHKLNVEIYTNIIFHFAQFSYQFLHMINGAGVFVFAQKHRGFSETAKFSC